MNTLHLWNLEGSTPAEMIKSVPFAGGRKQSAIDTYYKLKTITKVFGPMGVGWGMEVINLHMVPCGVWRDKEIKQGTMMVAHVRFWYRLTPELRESIGDMQVVTLADSSEIAEIHQFDMINNISMDADEDCCKKLLTDTITKAASYLGFFNDVFMGAFDGDRYVVEKMEKVNESMKVKFLELCKELMNRGYPEAKLNKMMDYHERQGYITASVIPDMTKMQAWLDLYEKEKKQDGIADHPLGS